MANYTFLRSVSSFNDIYSWAKKLITDLNANNISAGNAAAPTGALMAWTTAEPPSGWLICDGTFYTIADQPKLFVKIGFTYGGSGNEFAVPDFRDKLLMGAGTLVALNATAGAAEVTLTVDEMPAHTHIIDDPTHNHTFTADPHTHVIDDPQHTHTITDPKHLHAGGVGTAGTATAAGATGPTTPANTALASTGITINAAATGVTNENTTVTGHNTAAATGVTNETTGGGQPHSVLNPVFGVNMIIKA